MDLDPRRSLVARLFWSMAAFGVTVGLVFPPVVSPFVDFKEGKFSAFFLLCMVAGVCVGAFGFLLVRIILLRQVTAVSEQIGTLANGQGKHLASRIEFQSNDELGRLIDQFNRLIDRLQSTGMHIMDVADTLAAVSVRTRERTLTLAGGLDEKTTLMSGTEESVGKLEQNFKNIDDCLRQLQASSNESRSAVQSQVSQIEQVSEKVDDLHRQCRLNSETTGSAAEAVKKTAAHSQDLTLSLTESAAGMTEMDQTLREIQHNLKETSRLSEQVTSNAESGRQATSLTQEGMNRILESIGLSAGVIQSFSVKVKEIAAIAMLIDEVTDQTNLLALNAAIIAAQAGDHGRGFAVVAGQIKKLADKTSLSTREIGSLVQSFHDQARRAIKATDESKELASQGVALSQQSYDSLGSILGSADGSHLQIQAIEKSVKEIAMTSRYLSETLEGIAGKAKEISRASVEEEANLTDANNAIEGTRLVAGSLADLSREQLTASRKIREQTEKINQLTNDSYASVSLGEEETGRLSSIVESVLNLFERERKTTIELEEEGARLMEQHRHLAAEAKRFSSMDREEEKNPV